jgi:hypothetical protein
MKRDLDMIRTILGASILLLVSGQVNAGLITINYEGVVNTTTGDGFGYTQGDAISGWFQFDTDSLVDISGIGNYYIHEDGPGPVSSNTSAGKYSESLDEIALVDIASGTEQIMLVDASIQSCFDFTCASGNFLEEQYEYHWINLYNTTEWFDLDLLLAGGDVIFGDLPQTNNAAGYLMGYSAVQPTLDGSSQTVVFNDASFFVTSLQVSPVPAPAVVWLFGTGLIGLVGFSKRRKAA